VVQSYRRFGGTAVGIQDLRNIRNILDIEPIDCHFAITVIMVIFISIIIIITYIHTIISHITCVVAYSQRKHAMYMKNAVFWDVAPCRCCVNRLSLQPPAHAGSSLADFSTLKMEAIRSSETPVHTRSIRCHIPEDGILHSHCRENFESYTRYTNYEVF
jgi:hypothetical protein